MSTSTPAENDQLPLFLLSRPTRHKPENQRWIVIPHESPNNKIISAKPPLRMGRARLCRLLTRSGSQWLNAPFIIALPVKPNSSLFSIVSNARAWM